MMNCHPVIPWLVAAVCLGSATDPHPQCYGGSCGEGQKLGTNGSCSQCDKGTYMPYDGHECRSCFYCSNVTSPDEVIVAACTDRNDTLIACQKGYFTAGHNTPTTRSCTKCRECTLDEYVWSNCTETQDTRCSPLKTTTEAVMDESTSLENYFNTAETVNMVDETSDSPTSINTITVLLEGKTNICCTVLAIVLPVIVLIIIIIIFIGVKFRNQIRNCFLCKFQSRTYHVEEVSLATRHEEDETQTLKFIKYKSKFSVLDEIHKDRKTDQVESIHQGEPGTP